MEKAEGPRQFRQHAVQLKHSSSLYAEFESPLQMSHKAQPCPASKNMYLTALLFVQKAMLMNTQNLNRIMY